MATNSGVRREILEKLGISRQALSQRASKIKRDLGPITTEEAVYVIGHLEGIDLSRFLPISTLDRIRSLVPREIKPTKISEQRVRSVKKKQERHYPLVNSTGINIASKLGNDSYTKLFILENSIRALIVKKLGVLRRDWWDIYVPLKVKNNVARTINKEKHYPYREARGSDPLYYANFSDLSTIILENKEVFRDIILDFDWFKVKMEEIYMARNNLAHCVPLTRDDVSRINLFFSDWARLLETAGF